MLAAEISDFGWLRNARPAFKPGRRPDDSGGCALARRAEECVSPILELNLTVCALWLGARILRAGGGAPVRLVALFLLLTALGTAGVARGSVLPDTSDQLRFAVLAAGHLAISAGLWCLAGFSWLTFGRRSPWRRRLAIGLGGALSGAYLAQWIFDGFSVVPGPATLTALACRIACMGWISIETAAYHGALRRRQRLGLADPLVANRVLLWSLWTGAIAILMLAGAILRVVSVEDPGLATAIYRSVPFLSLTAVLSLVAAVALWLSFLPPQPYRDWIEHRAHPSQR
jgi:hypothetical protein